jgi:dipeptidyl aminopeptidase/acylaminoacyl peptidase
MSDLLKEIEVVSTIDNSAEKNLLFYPENKTNVPLVVGLHTWSFDRFNQQNNMLPLCIERGWALLLPEFRGPNVNTNPRAAQACASTLARQDVIDAVNWTIDKYAVDRDSIFLFGGSGGGHMALMMAAYAPQLWRAVSSWCPITDLADWHAENKGYGPHIEACCGGTPDDKMEEYKDRSPSQYLDSLMPANLSIHHGRADKSVPYTHTLKLAMQLEAMRHPRLFFEIFDGGHELKPEIAFNWFDKLHNATAGGKLTS